METAMQEKVILVATPVFFALIFIEWGIGLLRRRNTYRLNDTLNSLSLGVLSQISAAFLQALKIGAYAWLVQRIALFTLPADSPWVWISGLLLYDFCYYWQHRLSHQVNLLWASHVVHHQSEAYNLSTALRQPSSDALFVWIFYLPMALLGYPVRVFAVIALIDLLYQFWVHTQQIGKLGWFDRVFVSPSNHRAHHGVNDIYVDKNYGGMLILWDRLFGSFIEERDDEPVVYGTRSPLRSWNPVHANLEGYGALWLGAWHANRLRDKLRIWLARPGWQPMKTPAAPAFDIHHPLYDPQLPLYGRIYCLIQFGIVLLVTTHFLGAHRSMPTLHSVAYALWLSVSLWVVGGLLEWRPHFVTFERARLLATGAVVLLSGVWFGPTPLMPSAQAAIMIAVLGSLLVVRHAFRQPAATSRYLSTR